MMCNLVLLWLAETVIKFIVQRDCNQHWCECLWHVQLTQVILRHHLLSNIFELAKKLTHLVCVNTSKYDSVPNLVWQTFDTFTCSPCSILFCQHIWVYALQKGLMSIREKRQTQTATKSTFREKFKEHDEMYFVCVGKCLCYYKACRENHDKIGQQNRSK